MQKIVEKNLYTNIERLSLHGCRWLGTEGEERARQTLLHDFEQLNLDHVYSEWFTCHNYFPKKYELSLLSPQRLHIPCKPLEYSDSSEVQGELVFLGELKPDDSNRKNRIDVDLEDKICLIVSDTPAFFISELANKGAVGVIVATEAPDNLIRNLAAKSYPPRFDNPVDWRAEIPGVTISKQDLYKILTLTYADKAIVRIEHSWESRLASTCNVVGVLEGHEDQSIVVGAHYDSQIDTPGVWDNLTGLSTLMELARICSSMNNRKRIFLVAFAAEEIGLWGSSFFVNKHEQELRKSCIGMLCLDAVSSAFPAQKSLWAKGFLKDFIVQKAFRLGFQINNVFEPEFSYSDYYPFMQKNISAAMIWEYPPIYPYYHTEKDVLEFIDPAKLWNMAEFYRKIIEEMDGEKTVLH